jgi:DNA-binding MarR family transcriptional regulator
MASSTSRGRPAAPETAALVDGFLGASRALVALSARSLAQVDAEVTLVQYRALVVLASGGPQRTTDLAAELEVAPSTATRMSDRLVRKGLAERFRRGDDRRAAWVMLTPAGRDLVGAVMRHRRRAIAKLVRGLEVEDPQGLAAALEEFVAAAGEDSEQLWWRQWRTSTTRPADTVPA